MKVDVGPASWPTSDVTPVAEKYETYIKQLAYGTPADEAFQAYHVLEVSGIEAFPILVKHLDDDIPAAKELDGWDVFRSHPMDVGEACFHILQNELGGNWPKDSRQFYVLSEDNGGQWLAAHSGQTIDQLRKSARAESLRLAEAALAKTPESEFLQRTVKFLHRDYQHFH